MRFAELDAVTLDAHGTLVELANPVPELDRCLRERRIKRGGQEIARAFATEVDYYREHAHEGRDAETLARLRLECTGVFLGALEAELAPDDFVEAFVGSIRFEALPGTRRSLRALQRRGLALAVISNWDVDLHAHLDEAGLGGLAVVTSAEAGAPKPATAVFELAVQRLGVRRDRTLHVGDSEADEVGAGAAGLRFAPAPLATVLDA
ncbi:MAG TPA: HAD-IA family hydrolase [Gaiellaceae bacterium]|jgi:putative hydrolase of the HAD superfamily|nr:HAD-IA family hydrolase [Gaiellaceae bacterium]